MTGHENFTRAIEFRGPGHLSGNLWVNLDWLREKDERQQQRLRELQAQFPTICGTGTEDYFGGAWGFGDQNYSAPYLGFQTVAGKNGQVGARMTMYRFHIADPVFFHQDLRVTMQALGWRKEGRYLPLQDDIASVAYWYQTLPHQPFPPLPARNDREIV